MINLEKSALMFSQNTELQAKNTVKGAFGINNENWNDRYLGLLVHVGRVHGWQERLLAKTSKETLVKAVAKAISTFAMSCFDLTKGFCKELNTLMGKFWWSQPEKERTLHWISWETLTRPKAMGGLGFRDMHDFNIAMLSWQGWRFLQNPDNLCAHTLKARYFPHCSILEVVPRDGISYS